MPKREADYLKRINSQTVCKKMEQFGCVKSLIISWGDNGELGKINATVKITEPHNNYLQLNYFVENREFNYKVKIVTTTCNYGGVRYWFICPLAKNQIKCENRVGTLYDNGDYFGCRECCELTYKSRKKTRNSQVSFLANYFDIGDELYKIKNSGKRFSYGGKPTKTRRKLENLYRRRVDVLSGFELVEKGLKVGCLEKK